jgi:hypothetical protein
VKVKTLTEFQVNILETAKANADKEWLIQTKELKLSLFLHFNMHFALNKHTGTNDFCFNCLLPK